MNAIQTPLKSAPAETQDIDWLHDRAGLAFAAASALGPYVLAVVGPLFGLNG